MQKKQSNSTAVENIVDTLKQSIQRETLKPGDKLPTLREMERMYCVSRIVIREAIKVLEGQGLIYSKQGSGIYVAEKLTFDKPRALNNKEYSFADIYSLFKFIYDYAVFALRDREDLSEIVELQKLNRELIDNYSQLSNHEKFTYETAFGLRLIRLSENELANDLYRMLFEPMNNVDYLTIINNPQYIDILQMDKNLIESILNRDPYRASFWGSERTLKAIDAIKDKDIFQKKYVVFDN